MFHSARALLWQQDFSLERNECANVSQVGFIKLRPGTRVLTLDNQHVTKPGSGEMLTYSNTVIVDIMHETWEKNVYIETQFTFASTAESRRLISLLSNELFKTKQPSNGAVLCLCYFTADDERKSHTRPLFCLHVLHLPDKALSCQHFTCYEQIAVLYPTFLSEI